LKKQFDGYFIYALVDPRDNGVRYIGITTKSVDERLTQHLNDAWYNKEKKAWFTELKRLGLAPEMEILQVIEGGPDAQYIAKEREEYWIQEYLRLGIPLLNVRGVAKPYPKPKRRLFNRSSNSPPIHIVHRPPEQKWERNRFFSRPGKALPPSYQSSTMEVFQDLLENMPATLTELARRSGVSERSIMRMRDGEKVNRSTANKVLLGLSQLYGRTFNLKNVTGFNLAD
jgi:GIY-YIG catalytic domain